MRTGSSILAKSGDMSTRVITAKRVNEELHSLVASCERIKRRLMGKPGDPKLTDLLAKQETKLALCVDAGLAGKTFRHRG